MANVISYMNQIVNYYQLHIFNLEGAPFSFILELSDQVTGHTYWIRISLINHKMFADVKYHHIKTKKIFIAHEFHQFF